MATKRKKTKKSKSALKELSPTALKQSALGSLENHDFKKALPRLIRLYKIDNNEEIKANLITCYIGRIKELIAKNLYSEAKLLHNNLKIIQKNSLPNNLVMALLENTYQLSDLMEQCLNTAIDPSKLSLKLKEKLVYYGYIKQLTPEQMPSIITSHTQQLDELIETLCQTKDSEQLLALAKSISLKSPLRDWRLIIISMAMLDKNKEKTLALLLKLPIDSPSQTIAKVIRITCYPKKKQFEEIETLTDNQLKLFQRLSGISDKQLKTIKQYNKVKNQPSQYFLKFLIKLKQELPAKLYYQLGMLAYDGSNQSKTLLKKNWPKISSFFYCQYKAAQLDTERDSSAAAKCDLWQSCIDAILRDPSIPKDTIGRIKIHQYHLIEKEERCTCCTHSLAHVELLIDSLHFLPESIETYLEICHFYQRENKKSALDKWTKAILTQFPDNIRSLTFCSRHCITKKQYTKATTLLEKALQIDPVNVTIKQLLAESHAKKLTQELFKKKNNLITKSLTKLTLYQNYLTPPDLYHIYHCITELFQSNLLPSKSYEKLLYNNHPFLVRCLIIIVNADVTSFGIKTTLSVTKIAPSSLNYTELAHALSNLKNALSKGLIKALDAIDNDTQLLEGISKMDVSQADVVIRLCAQCLELKLYNFLCALIKTAKNQQCMHPLLQYYGIQGRTKQQVSQITDIEHDKLIKLYETLDKNMENMSALDKVVNLLDEYDDYHEQRDDIPVMVHSFFESMMG